MEFVVSAAPSIISAICIGALGWFGRSLVGFNKEHGEVMQISHETSDKLDSLLAEHDALMESQRNQIKAQIVSIYQIATSRGYITPMELDTVNRMADSYFALGGNHYIHALVKRMNCDMPIVGEPIPETEKECIYD